MAVQIAVSSCIELRSNPGYYLRSDAAKAWDRAVAAFGKLVLITGAWRSYETQEKLFDGEKFPNQTPQYGRYLRGNRSGQRGFTNDVRWWPAKNSYWTRKEGTASAAVPGTSNHGGGIAVDVKTSRSKSDPSYDTHVIFTSFSDPDRLRFLRVAAEHGWDDDEGRGINEPWHLTYYASRDQHRGESVPAPPQKETFLMALSDKQQEIMFERIEDLYSGTAPRIPTSATKDPETITLRAALRDTLLALTRQLDDAVARGVGAALEDVTGVDKAALTAGVVAEVRKELASAEYVLTPKED